jgi:deoxyguanosine kinase
VGDDYEVFETVYQRTSGALEPPDVTVFLDLEHEHILDRIRARGRDYERDMDPAYLRGLAQAYDARFLDLGQRVEHVHIARSATREDVAAAVAAACSFPATRT